MNPFLFDFVRLYHNLPVIGETTEVIFSMISWLTGAALIASAMLVYPLTLASIVSFLAETEIEEIFGCESSPISRNVRS